MYSLRQEIAMNHQAHVNQVKSLIQWMADRGWSLLRVSDGECSHRASELNESEIIDIATSCDEAALTWLDESKQRSSRGTAYLVFGNNPAELVSDFGGNEACLKELMAWSDHIAEHGVAA